ncbi:hypothetical protein [Arthrobacter sp. zg-Y769]|uniref:hypothetical protein n=1 Tax=Arthrobacter sp. zg-Y769 TaxID=2894191 RepID=UPI001E4D42DD|nr:hypothetical protein [Arthrobacter sp. zg-Y769]MCC9203986.1 hypothetical protein [Arthrobacter sp. zg-Y769]
MALRPAGKAQAGSVAGAARGAHASDAEGRTDPANSGPAGTEPKDRGAGTVAAIGICMVLLGFSVVALVMVQVSVAAVRAAAAADLAALAGADTLRGLRPAGASTGVDPDAAGLDAGGLDAGDMVADDLRTGGPGAGAASGAGDACGVAGEVAARNNAALRDCTADPGSGTVTVETEVQVPALPVPAVARARAGPPG